ncbi:glycosyltransferase family 28 domain-containing protein [Sodiomyces alkalinus F11]|uniref:UDP-N-acetylglucosamine transferase subunit ALG13 n=1 Tax=Sodiomyces alkalinus (strain CBS 110278 / VKM F-3762 / F11) TaxID=1314773 RepID=A0A3N2PM83_SODAK|nr:glycosyltransferase family 28 domain-containing protein [Sodiomyces alkalinus F11]ROT35641.1 glycosyltransferase family 28 domain-containing protein [Sodiomyces alkalinus F11]
MSTVQSSQAPSERHCLVTVGATARFTQLLAEVLESPFLSVLRQHGFTHLTVQCGKDLDWFRATISKLSSQDTKGLQITGFDFVDDLMHEMVKCRAQAPSRRDGVVISHAGTGTLLDGLRVGTPLIVVPNPTLKDNHQAELAEEVQSQGYAIWGRLGQIDYALEQSELLCDKNAQKFRSHPISGSRASQECPDSGELIDVDLWSVSAAMMNRYAGTRESNQAPIVGATPAGELRREEASQMALD